MVMASGEQLHEPSAIEWFGDSVDLAMKLLCMAGTHCSEDLRGAGRQRGLAYWVMRNRSLQDRVVQR